MTHVLHNGPVYLGAPLALEAPKALDLECLLAPLALDLGLQVASRALC